MAVFALFVALGSGGCGEDATTSPDLGVGSSDQGATLTLTAAGRTQPMAAVYSFYVEPLADNPAEEGVYLVVTAIDPAFDCAHPAGGFDVLSFLFQARGAGATSTTVLTRRGPDLDAATGGSGSATLDADDDRLSGYDLDGGTVSAGAGGSVAGHLHFDGGGVTVDGAFDAARCAALDFIVPQ